MAYFRDEEKFGKDFLDDIIEWVKGNLDPDVVFEESVLRDWALDNGFVEEE